MKKQMNFPKKNETKRLIGKQYPSPTNQKNLKERKEKGEEERRREGQKKILIVYAGKKSLRNEPRTKWPGNQYKTWDGKNDPKKTMSQDLATNYGGR